MLITCLNQSWTGPGHDRLVFISPASQPGTLLINTLYLVVPSFTIHSGASLFSPCVLRRNRNRYFSLSLYLLPHRSQRDPFIIFDVKKHERGGTIWFSMHSVISDLPADLGPEIVSYPPDLIKAVRPGALLHSGQCRRGTCGPGPRGRDGGGGGVDNYHI